MITDQSIIIGSKGSNIEALKQISSREIRLSIPKPTHLHAII